MSTERSSNWFNKIHARYELCAYTSILEDCDIDKEDDDDIVLILEEIETSFIYREV